MLLRMFVMEIRCQVVVHQKKSSPPVLAAHQLGACERSLSLRFPPSGPRQNTEQLSAMKLH